MNAYKKFSMILGFIACILIPTAMSARTAAAETTSTDSITEIAAPAVETDNHSEELFEAKITEVVEERTVEQPDGAKVTQQHLKMKGLEGDWKNKEIEFNGISEIIAVSGNIYRVGDRVLINHQKDADENDVFYIADYVRRAPIYVLAFIFALAVALIGKTKGLRSIIALFASFIIILKATIPLILYGWNPLIVGIGSCIIIFIIIIYVTDGWSAKSHMAILNLTIALIIVALISWLFTWLMRLTGTAGEETLFLIGIGKKAIDFKGLFLAGVLIGALGVLDDIVIGQIESVAQIKKANPNLPKKQVFKMAMDIGNAHIGAMVNTLFLAYAGASLPLLILFSVNEPPFLTFGQVINNELIASEIARTLVGSIGLVLAMPIATYIAAHLYREKNRLPN